MACCLKLCFFVACALLLRGRCASCAKSSVKAARSFIKSPRAMRAQARQVLTGVLGFMMYKLALVSVTVLPPMSHSVAEVQRRA